MLKSPAHLCKALLLSIISLLLLAVGPLAAQNMPYTAGAVAKRHTAKVASHRAVKVATHHPVKAATHHTARVAARHIVKIAKRRAVKVAKRHAVKAERQRAHHARAIRLRRVEVHKRMVRIYIRRIAWERHHRRAVIMWPSHPGQIWAAARLPGYENRVRAAPARWAHIIEKIRHGTRFRVIGKARDHSGTLYYRAALRDGRIGWLNHVCVRFLR